MNDRSSVFTIEVAPNTYLLPYLLDSGDPLPGHTLRLVNLPIEGNRVVSGEVLLEAAAKPATPSLAGVVSRLSLASCDTALKEVAIGSTELDSNGRNLSSIVWACESSNVPGGCIAITSEVLAGLAGKTAGTVSLLNVMSAGQSATISVTLTNWLGGVSKYTILIEVTPVTEGTATVSITSAGRTDADGVHRFLRTQPMRFTASGSYQSCNSAAGGVNATFQWSSSDGITTGLDIMAPSRLRSRNLAIQHAECCHLQ
jgi:hypothetical protein